MPRVGSAAVGASYSAAAGASRSQAAPQETAAGLNAAAPAFSWAGMEPCRAKQLSQEASCSSSTAAQGRNSSCANRPTEKQSKQKHSFLDFHEADTSLVSLQEARSEASTVTRVLSQPSRIPNQHIRPHVHQHALAHHGGAIGRVLGINARSLGEAWHTVALCMAAGLFLGCLQPARVCHRHMTRFQHCCQHLPEFVKGFLFMPWWSTPSLLSEHQHACSIAVYASVTANRKGA